MFSMEIIKEEEQKRKNKRKKNDNEEESFIKDKIGKVNHKKKKRRKFWKYGIIESSVMFLYWNKASSGVFTSG